MLVFFLLLVAIVQGKYWFSTESPSAPETDDFRGCYVNRCLYVSESPLYLGDTRLFPYQQEERLWAIAFNHTVLFVKSPERPVEVTHTLWISPVPSSRLVEAPFDPTPYLRNDPDPIVVRLLDAVNERLIQEQVVFLADHFHTRNSVSADAVEAARYLETRFKEIGCEFAQLKNFRSGYSPNVVCELRGTEENLPALVLGAHYDSRSTSVTSPTQRAPGADDNGSGTAAVLDILRAIVEVRRAEGFAFRRSILFALFSGEEQGLYGSAALAAEFKSRGTALTAMVNIDMIGYPQSNAPQTLYWMSGSANRPLTDMAFSLTKLYLGQNTVVATTPACCSDQQSFHGQGYAAAGIFESLSAYNNPHYHQSSDLPNTVNFQHVVRNTKSAFALLATLAEPVRR